MARQPVPEGESRAEKFTRVAPQRVRNALKAINLVGATANARAYEYTREQQERVIKALEAELDAVKTAFANGGNTEQDKFAL